VRERGGERERETKDHKVKTENERRVEMTIK
jgi:hypothetical protein